MDITICLREVDPEWNITWPTTDSGQTVLQKCPGGAESVGMCIAMYLALLFLMYIFVFENLK